MSVLSDFLAGVKSTASKAKAGVKKAASYIPAESFAKPSKSTAVPGITSGAKLIKDLAVGTARLPVTLPTKALLTFTNTPSYTPVTGLEKFLVGNTPVASYTSDQKSIQKWAKDKGLSGNQAIAIGAIGAIGEAGLDFFTGGKGKTINTIADMAKANTTSKVSKIVKQANLSLPKETFELLAKETDPIKISKIINIGIEDSNFRKSVTAGLSQRAAAVEKEIQVANRAPVIDFEKIAKLEQERLDIPKMAQNLQKMEPEEVFDMGNWLKQRGVDPFKINEQGLASGVLPGRIEIPKVAPKAVVPKSVEADLMKEARKFTSAEDFYERSGGILRDKLRESGIKGQEQFTNFWNRATSSQKRTDVLDNAMQHRPTRTGANASDVSQKSSEMGIPDFYEHPEWYHYGGKEYDESVSALMLAKGNPDATITIYRATPKNELRTGDWVTLSKEKARLESLTEGSKVQSFKVKAKDVEFAGDDITEFGYWGDPLTNKTKTLKGFVGGGKLPEDAPAAKVSAYIKEMIGKREKEAPGIVERAKDLYKTAKSKLVDFNAPIEDVLASSQKKFGYEVRPTYDYTNQVDRVLRSPTLAGNFIRETGMEQLIRDVPNIDYLDQYLIAKQSRRLERMGFETGRNLAKDGELIAALGKEYEPFAKRVYAFSDKLLDYTVKSGLISDDLAKKLRVLYPEYVPMNRVMDELESAGEFGTKGVASLSSQSVVQKLKGSTREVKNPIASLLEKTVVAFEQGEKNKAAKLLAGYKDLPGNPFGLRELKASDTARNTISYLENGVKRRFETLSEIEQAAKALGVQRLNILGKIFAAPVRIAKLGITGINIPFVAANIVRDQVLAFVTSKHGLKTSIANPAVFIESVYNALGHKELYKRMVKEGGAGTSFDIARNQAEASLVEARGLKGLIKGEGTAKSKIKYVADTPARLLRAVEDVVGRSEELTRLQQFAGTEKALIKAGRTPEDARILAAKAARENTANFARRGEWGQVLNSAFLYLNASIQGSRSFIRALEREPIKTSAKLATSVFLPVSIATAWNLNDPKRKEAYMDIQDYEKENNIIIVPENPVKDENGKWDVIKMPLPPGMGRLASVPRRFIEQSQGLDPVSFKKIAQDLIASVSPVTPEVKSIASTLTPQAIKPTIEATMNKSLFTGVPQVSKKLENLPNELQVKKDTSFTARLVAGYFDVSPIKVQEFVKGTFGSVGLQALNAIDNVFEKTGRIQPEEVGGQSVIDAVFARFGKATGGREANKLYEQIAEQNKAEAGIKFKAKEGVQERFDTIRELAKQGDYAKMQEITNAMTPEEYKAYKGMAQAWKSANMTKTRSLLDVNPREAVRFVRSLDQFEQKRLVENLTPEEYEIYSLGK